MQNKVGFNIKNTSIVISGLANFRFMCMQQNCFVVIFATPCVGMHILGYSCFERKLSFVSPTLTKYPSYRQELYGPNLIDVNVKSYARLFLEEVLFVHVVKCFVFVYPLGKHNYTAGMLCMQELQ